MIIQQPGDAGFGQAVRGGGQMGVGAVEQGGELAALAIIAADRARDGGGRLGGSGSDARCGIEAAGEGGEAGGNADAGAANGGFKRLTWERQGGGGGQRAKQGGGDDAAGAFGDGLHVRADEAFCLAGGGGEHRGAVGGAVAGFDFLQHRQRPMRRGDEHGFIRRDQSALDGAAGFHQFGGHHHIDIAGHRHQ